MKRMNLKLILVGLCMAFSVNAQAQLGNLLKNVLGGGNSSEQQTETSTAEKVGGLVSIFQNLIGKGNGSTKARPWCSSRPTC